HRRSGFMDSGFARHARAPERRSGGTCAKTTVAERLRFGAHAPDVARIGADRAVGGEPAGPRGARDARLPPRGSIVPARVERALRAPIGIEIGGDHEMIV